MIVDIFGTWCPNCHDEAPLLEQLYRKYRAQGLVIVGLAYEYVDDTARDLRQIGIYRDKYGIDLSVAAGRHDRRRARSKRRCRSWSTSAPIRPRSFSIATDGCTPFMPGFAGPSTGEKYQEVQQHMDQLTREIVGPSN